MHTSTFFKIFPPPKFLMMKHTGLEISDDAVHCLEFSNTAHGPTISKFANMDVAAGLIDGGDIKDDIGFKALLAAFEKKNNLSYVKVSVPEEKAYLFQTDVPDADFNAIEQNIESKIEQNVPLSAPDAVFYFDLMPLTVTGGALRASVSVVPRTYIEYLISSLEQAGIYPMAFEVVPKSIARALVSAHSDDTVMLVHMLNKKTGIYIVSGGVVCFTSTVGYGSTTHESESKETYIQALSKEINRIYSYWMTHDAVHAPLASIVLAGRDAPLHENALQNVVSETHIPVKVADVWHNTLDMDAYIPPISREDSLDYVVAAGLAMQS